MGIASTIGRATSKATSKLQKKSRGLALGLSKNPLASASNADCLSSALYSAPLTNI